MDILLLDYENNMASKCIFPECNYILSTYNDSIIINLDIKSLSINKFEEYIMDRLSILHFIDNKCNNDDNKSLLESNNKNIIDLYLSEKGFKLPDINKIINKENSQINNINKYYEIIEEIFIKDAISHFFLKLVYLNNRDKQDWFIKQEIRLMIFKLSNIINSNVFTKSYNINKKIEIINKLMISNFGDNYPFLYYDDILNNKEYEDIWYKAISIIPNGNNIKRLLKVPFWPDGYNFIKYRRYFIKDGICYIPENELENLFISRFKRSLINTINLLKNNEYILNKYIYSDLRISGFLRNIGNSYLGSDYNYNEDINDLNIIGNKLDISNINKLSIISFPLCMRRLFEYLKQDHHLKHWGRLQLWLFLKGCGMNLDEQIKLWRSLWIDHTSFDKEIKYNIRHAYGQEGKRSNYLPYPCNKIINGLPLPGNGQNHGCPFKTFDITVLKKLLQNYYGNLIDSNQIQNITNLSKIGHYQLACLDLFKILHPDSNAQGIGNHPNSYFKQSMIYWNKKN
ncbi:DNA primase, large subunit family protein [Cryptosporidium muris RN66]|uniref:DNA primase, large subunit family protein n=1 Tax=Cryptosporidium muris (strain RN66) TaxID=441375 RepID=B6AAX6_CRYMR|nr:DNA primase, large subunit family protein [Cryptosporidium muris RN66]EEA05528.1 DNA primase, large subunit family protein [Cryptosporidium muris RN66]|eukprot:XP_002139877.1 DNA primase, large subunit family protein [Cryptosporidium muris RN66]